MNRNLLHLVVLALGWAVMLLTLFLLLAGGPVKADYPVAVAEWRTWAQNAEAHRVEMLVVMESQKPAIANRASFADHYGELAALTMNELIRVGETAEPPCFPAVKTAYTNYLRDTALMYSAAYWDLTTLVGTAVDLQPLADRQAITGAEFLANLDLAERTCNVTN